MFRNIVFCFLFSFFFNPIINLISDIKCQLGHWSFIKKLFEALQIKQKPVEDFSSHEIDLRRDKHHIKNVFSCRNNKLKIFLFFFCKCAINALVFSPQIILFSRLFLKCLFYMLQRLNFIFRTFNTCIKKKLLNVTIKIISIASTFEKVKYH